MCFGKAVHKKVFPENYNKQITKAHILGPEAGYACIYVSICFIDGCSCRVFCIITKYLLS